MKVSIWDLDYYYATDRTNRFNPDVMRISSYHKQLGDTINFVTKQDDIHRPYDLYYIVRENSSTPQPPAEFFADSRVRWWGAAYKRRWNWRMSDAMWACRPDYLLYPEKETRQERAEQVRLLGANGNLLELTQDWTNTFKRKIVLEVDTNLWTVAPEITLQALKKLEDIENLSFFEPIWIYRLVNDEEIMEQFLKLKFKLGANLTWSPVWLKDFEQCYAAVKRVQQAFPNLKLGPLDARIVYSKHWVDSAAASKDWSELQQWVIRGKKEEVRVGLHPMGDRLDSPYFLLFETLHDWLHFAPKLSWLEWISWIYGPGLKRYYNEYWNHPEQWNDVFRQLLQQTFQNKEFLLAQWGNKKLSENDIPWQLGKNISIWYIRS